MKIEVKEKPTKEFAREMVSASQTFKDILKHPEKKPKDSIKSMQIMFVIAILGIIVDVALYIVDRSDVIALVCIGIFLFCAILSLVMIINGNKTITFLTQQGGNSIFTVDENGITITKETSEMRMNWNQLLQIDVLEHGALFIPKDNTSMIMGIQKNM